MWCRLPVDVNRRADVVEDLIECAESGIVPPAVDVGRLDVEDLFTEPFGDELRDTCLAGAAGTSDDGGVSGFSVRDRFKDAREMVDFGIAMLNFPRDESGAENASIADHLLLLDLFPV